MEKALKANKNSKGWELQGKELQKLREKYSNFNQNVLAKKLNISRSLLSLLESGERKASKEIIFKLTEILSLRRYEKIKQLLIYEYYDEVILRPMNQENRVLCIELVKDLKANGFLKQSKTLAQIGLEMFGNSTELFVLLANISLINKEYEHAKEQTLRALELQSKNSLISKAEISHNIGNICLNLGLQFEFERNRIIIEKELASIKNNKKQVNLLENKIKELNFKMLNLYKEGEDFLKKAETEEPNHEYILETLARLFYNISKVSDNEDYLNKSIEYFTKFITSNKSKYASGNKQYSSIILAFIIAKAGKFEEANLLIHEALNNQEQENALTYYCKSLIYSINGKGNYNYLEISFKNLKRAIELDKDNIYNLKKEVQFDTDLLNLRFSGFFVEELEVIFGKGILV